MRKEYGNNVIGIDNDTFGEKVSPLRKTENGFLTSIVNSYNVLYGIDAAKNEMNFIFDLIGILFKDNQERIEFAEYILPYFIFSYKDKKRQYENERRFDIVYFSDFEYLNVNIEDGFYKVDSLGYSFPDWCDIDNVCYENIKSNIDKKNRFC